MSLIDWTCPATPERPCMCGCHMETVDYGNGEEVCHGCSTCSGGSKLEDGES